ncbi:MAG TPA: alpha/beta hydrolase [Solirubrobacteraceae bacterium]|jgi:pimeloyl-ACP methyl ester carboxylesterase
MTDFTPAHRGGQGPPLICLHGFTDTWRTWELVLPRLERHHEVLAPTLPGHAGGPPLPAELDDEALVAGVERAMDEAGWDTAHVVGNSLGGWVALQLAARGRARSVVALAPAGGWAEGDPMVQERLDYFTSMRQLVRGAAPYADQIASTPEGRRRATEYIAVNYDHIPAELVAHQIRGAAGCDGAEALIARAREAGYPLQSDRIGCPLRVVWGTEDRLLTWPTAAVRYREFFPDADWVELPEIGHCPQLDVPAETAELILGFAGAQNATQPMEER